MVILENDLADEAIVKKLMESNVIRPRIRQLEGDDTWAVKIRKHKGRLVMHILNRAIEGIPHPDLTSPYGGGRILLDIKNTNKQEVLSYAVKTDRMEGPWENLYFMSPETGSVKREVAAEQISDDEVKITFSIKDIRLYGIVSQ